MWDPMSAEILQRAGKRGEVPSNAVRQRSIRGTYFGVNAGGARTPEENERERARELP